MEFGAITAKADLAYTTRKAQHKRRGQLLANCLRVMGASVLTVMTAQ
jgi:hypothetical protein